MRFQLKCFDIGSEYGLFEYVYEPSCSTKQEFPSEDQ
jgi:hypothetical protein